MGIYINSNNIKMYPSSYRDPNYDPGSALLTEYNITNLTNKLNLSNSYVITDGIKEDSYLQFVINGYFFSLDNTAINDITNIEGTGSVWACINILEAADLVDYPTLVKCYDETTEIKTTSDLDSDGTFQGIYFVKSEDKPTLNNSTHYLKILEYSNNEWIIPASSRSTIENFNLKDNTIEEAKIKEKTITNTSISDTAGIDGSKLADNTITSTQLGDIISNGTATANGITIGLNQTDSEGGLNLTLTCNTVTNAGFANIADTSYRSFIANSSQGITQYPKSYDYLYTYLIGTNTSSSSNKEGKELSVISSPNNAGCALAYNKITHTLLNLPIQANNDDYVLDNLSGLEEPINIYGTATEANKLSTARNFSLTGDVTASSKSFNGSANVVLNTTIGNGKVTNDKLANNSIKFGSDGTSVELGNTIGYSNSRIGGTFYITNLDVSGEISTPTKVTATAFYATSDERLKENIREYEYHDSILDLPVKQFNYKSDPTKTTIGCIAQELQAIYPELVETDKDGYLKIAENKLVYLLLEEVKQLKEEIKQLKEGK